MIHALIAAEVNTLKHPATLQSLRVYLVQWESFQLNLGLHPFSRASTVLQGRFRQQLAVIHQMIVCSAARANFLCLQAPAQLEHARTVHTESTLLFLGQTQWLYASRAVLENTQLQMATKKKLTVCLVLLAHTLPYKEHQLQNPVCPVLQAPSQLQLEQIPSASAFCVVGANTVRLLEPHEKSCAKIARQASISKQRVMTRQQIAGHVMLGHSLLSVGLCLEQHARCALPESTLTLRVTQKKTIAPSALSANTLLHLQPHQLQHARVVQQARHHQQAVGMKEIALTNVLPATLGSLELARPARQAPTSQTLEAGAAFHVHLMQRAHLARPPASAKQASQE
jgi:hypothetical protein